MRDVHEVAGPGHDPLVAQPERRRALQDVEGLVLVAVGVRRRPAARRDDRQHREVRAVRLVAGDEEGVEVARAPERPPVSLRPVEQRLRRTSHSRLRRR